MSDDRATRYAARLDAHLATLTDDLERRRFCDREAAKWEERYSAFITDPGESKDDGPSAADYLETICEISLRQIRYGSALLEVRT